LLFKEDDNHARPMEDRLVNSGMPSGNKVYDQALVKLVMVGTGCTDAVRVCQVRVLDHVRMLSVIMVVVFCTE
jgi:hypothetical protein